MSWRERGVRWRDEDFEMRCDDCARRSDAAGMYWPLTLEFWNPALGLSRCRACWRAYSRRKARERRTIEEVHQKTLEYARRYREKNREIIKIRNRRYSKEKRERLKKKREDLVRSA